MNFIKNDVDKMSDILKILREGIKERTELTPYQIAYKLYETRNMCRRFSNNHTEFISKYAGHSFDLDKLLSDKDNGVKNEYFKIQEDIKILKSIILNIYLLIENKHNLSENQLLELQALTFNVLNNALERGYQDGAICLTKVIASGEIDTQDCIIENKDDAMRDILITIVYNYAKRTRLEVRGIRELCEEKNNIRNREDVTGQTYLDKAQKLIDDIFNGEYGEEFKHDEDFYRYLASVFNHYIKTSKPEKFYEGQGLIPYAEIRNFLDEQQIEY